MRKKKLAKKKSNKKKSAGRQNVIIRKKPIRRKQPPRPIEPSGSASAEIHQGIDPEAARQPASARRFPESDAEYGEES